jgi:hypothetical protein
LPASFVWSKGCGAANALHEVVDKVDDLLEVQRESGSVVNMAMSITEHGRCGVNASVLTEVTELHAQAIDRGDDASVEELQAVVPSNICATQILVGQEAQTGSRAGDAFLHVLLVLSESELCAAAGVSALVIALTRGLAGGRV